MKTNHYTYRVSWSPEDGEHVATCVEFPSLSWLAKTPEVALTGVRRLVAKVVADLQASGEPVPPRWPKKPTAANSVSASRRNCIARWRWERV